MMGRGLVEPLDLHHAKNLPSHPELLDLLARRFEAMNYDIKALLRELALSRTYQRASLLPERRGRDFSGKLRRRAAAGTLAGTVGLEPAASDRTFVGRIWSRPTAKLKEEDPEHYDALRHDWTWKKKVYDRFERDANAVAGAVRGDAG